MTFTLQRRRQLFPAIVPGCERLNDTLAERSTGPNYLRHLHTKLPAEVAPSTAPVDFAERVITTHAKEYGGVMHQKSSISAKIRAPLAHLA